MAIFSEWEADSIDRIFLILKNPTLFTADRPTDWFFLRIWTRTEHISDNRLFPWVFFVQFTRWFLIKITGVFYWKAPVFFIKKHQCFLVKTHGVFSAKATVLFSRKNFLFLIFHCYFKFSTFLSLRAGVQMFSTDVQTLTQKRKVSIFRETT